MANTFAEEIIHSFESSFADMQVLPDSLELEWLKKAIGRYSVELSPLNFNEELLVFDACLDRYSIDILAEMMKQMYLERQWSLVNKRFSIVGKDLSIDGNDGAKTAAKEELEYVRAKTAEMIQKQKTQQSTASL